MADCPTRATDPEYLGPVSLSPKPTVIVRILVTGGLRRGKIRWLSLMGFSAVIGQHSANPLS